MGDRINVWGGPFHLSPQEDQTTTTTDDLDFDRSAYRSPETQSEEEVKQTWLLRPNIERTKIRRKKFSHGKMLKHLAGYAALAGFITLVVVLALRGSHHHRPPPVSDNYTIALHHALFFFNAQRCTSYSLLLIIISLVSIVSLSLVCVL